MSQTFDIVVIGTGPGGYIAALKAAQMGAHTAVVEKSHLGGTCLNWGCIPSKALLSSAELIHQIRHASDWGVSVGGPVAFDWSQIQKRKDKVVQTLRGGIKNLFKGRDVTLYRGVGQLEAPGRVAVSSDDWPTQQISARSVIIATGSNPTRIPGWPSEPEVVCTSDEALHWKDLPKRILIVGGGVIGCEFACMLEPLGVQVTIVEMLDGLLPGLDVELGQGLHKVFKRRGINVHLGTKVEDMSVSGSGATARLSNGQDLEVDRVLVAVGRSPNTRDLGLEGLGVEMSRKGFVRVDDNLQTNVADHYCIGDANGKCLLAHAASAHGVCAVENALGHARPFEAPIPSAVYTFPEVGAVGMTEQEAAEQGVPVAVGRFPISILGKAMASNHTEGFVKMIRHRESGDLLGAHMLGHGATESIAAAAALLHQRVTMQDVAETVFAHPTIGEAIRESAEDALGMGLHLPPREIIRAEAVV